MSNKLSTQKIMPAAAPVAAASTGSSILLRAGISLLNVSLTAAFERDDTGYRILVMPTDAKSNPMSIGEMVDQVNKFIKDITGNENSVNGNEISKQLEGLVNVDQGESILDKIKVCLKQVFLYVESKSDTQSGDVTNSTGNVEYAFDLEIQNDIAPGFEVFNLTSLEFAIWNTDRKAVIDRMELASIKELLDAQQS